MILQGILLVALVVFVLYGLMKVAEIIANKDFWDYNDKSDS